MAVYQITYWHEIPSQVDARDPGQPMQKQPLSPRFIELIDMVATKRDLGATDDYIAGWNKGEKVERTGAAKDVVREVAAELEAQYEAIKASALAQSTPQ